VTEPVQAPLFFDIVGRRRNSRGGGLSLGPALQYLLDHLPPGAYNIGFEGDLATSEVAVIRIDWSKVPSDIRQGAAEL
jgi:hypothetical protein